MKILLFSLSFVNLSYTDQILIFFQLLKNKPHRRAKQKYRSLLHAYLFSLQNLWVSWIHTKSHRRSHYVHYNPNILSSPPRPRYLMCKTRQLCRRSQNPSRLWQVIDFIRSDADWVLPSAALSNVQNDTVWKVRTSVFKTASSEQVSKKCYLQPDHLHWYFLLIIMLILIFISSMS